MSGELSRSVQVRVSGQLACFTRPENKVERVTYPIVTPSAARGICDSILWKPQFRWVILSIALLREPEYISFTRNEVQKKIPTNAVSGWAADPSSYRPFFANTRGREEGENATQRSTLALKDVAYVITARALVDGEDLRPEDTAEKYASMFERRVANGQCYRTPVLGCREFAAHFEPPRAGEQPSDMTADFGLMLYDIIYDPAQRQNEAAFFHARIEGGVMVTDPDIVLADVAERERLLAC